MATHGFTDEGADFLIASDTVRRHVQRTGIPVEVVFDEVSQAVSPRRILLLDACRERLNVGERAGGVSEDSRMGQAFADAILASEGLVVLSGATIGGFAYDDHEQKNGVFSAAVIQGLQGAAGSNEKGFISAAALSDYVNDRVAEWVTRNRPGHGQAKGIESRISGQGANLPLAVDPSVHSQLIGLAERKEKALGLLRMNMDFENLTGSMLDEIVEIFETVEPSSLEPLLMRIERFEKLGPSYAEDFAFWWTERGRRVNSGAGVPAVDVSRAVTEDPPTPRSDCLRGRQGWR